MSERIKENTSALMTLCPECKGSGKISIFKTIEGYSYPVEFLADCPVCKGGQSQRAEIRKSFSNIPQSYYQSRLKDFDWNIYRDKDSQPVKMTSKKLFVDGFIEKFEEIRREGKGIYIYSRTKGSGKTFLASCICNELIDRYAIKTRFVRATDILNIAQSGDKSSPDEYEKNRLKIYSECELLVIDDIGQKKTGLEWLSEELFKIIDDRYTKKLVTVYTSNLRINELEIDDRIIDRINKTAIEFPLPEYNVRSREANKEKIDFFRKLGLIREE